MNILLYIDLFDPVTRILLQNQEKLEIIPVPLKSLIDQAEIFDQLTRTGVLIEWNLPHIGKITNSEENFLINRLYHFPKELFESFCIEDRNYARSEFWSYLLFAIDAFPSKTEGPGVGSLMGSCLSLPAQWEMVQSHSLHIQVPNYYIGPVDILPREFVQTETVVSDVFNYYTWKQTEEKVGGDSVFIFSKPKGIPILASFLGSDSSLHGMNNENPLPISNEMNENLLHIIQEIRKIFNYFIGEILLFVDNDKITFGMCTNIPIASQYTPNFDGKVQNFFKTESRTNGLPRPINPLLQGEELLCTSITRGGNHGH